MKIFTEEQRRGLIVAVPLLLIVLLLSVLVERRVDPMLLTPQEGSQSEADSVVMRPFDPNEAEYEELRRCGVPPTAAVGIVRWRRYGKVYRMKEDVALCTGVDDSLYAVLKPYIVIGEEYAARPRGEGSTYDSKRTRQPKSGNESPAADEHLVSMEMRPFSLDTVSKAFLVGAGFSPRQAEVVLRYRDASGGIRSEEQFRRCYVVSDEMADRLLPYIIFAADEVPTDDAADAADDISMVADKAARALVEINTADSAALISVRGIGLMKEF